MNYFDIIVGGLLILALVKGFKNGLVIELATLAALVLGVLGAIKFSDITEQYLSQHINSSHIGLISFFVTFILIVIGVHLIAKLLDKLVSAVALGLINRILGAAFSALKYAFIISVLLAVFNSFDKNFDIVPDKQKESSILYIPMSTLALTIFPYLHFNEIKDRVKDASKGVAM